MVEKLVINRHLHEQKKSTSLIASYHPLGEPSNSFTGEVSTFERYIV